MTLVYLVVIALASIAVLWRYRRHARGLITPSDQLYHIIKGAPPVASRRQNGVILLVIVSMFVMFFMFDAGFARRTRRGIHAYYPIAIVAGVIGLISAYGIHVRARAKWIRALKESDGALCPHCGYSLRGLPDHQNCPECGRPYDLEQVRACWRNWLGR
ncbi:MAG: hypothetical protein HZA51_13355 [Planctomycetes bacterium]|nr:hypothetical protein [Planctomycetota bacterium]